LKSPTQFLMTMERLRARNLKVRGPADAAAWRGIRRSLRSASSGLQRYVAKRSP
jgi:hypothetical protein